MGRREGKGKVKGRGGREGKREGRGGREGKMEGRRKGGKNGGKGGEGLPHCFLDKSNPAAG